MFNQFIQNIEKVHLNKGNHVLIAVSGGIDSIVLAHLAKQYFKKVSIAHCNFNLRGEESLRDENFVKEFALTLQVPLYLVGWDTSSFANSQHISIQEAARHLRYKWFDEILEGMHKPQFEGDFVSSPPEFLMTAHHADDQIETFFIHLNRGSGLKGLKGILPKKNKIIRPLLNLTKLEIQQYSNENFLSYVEDSSNTSDKYTRNFFRLNILPLIEDRFPQFGKSLLRNIHKLQGGYELYQLKLNELIKDLIVEKNNEIHIPIRKLIKLPAYQTILWEIIEHYGFSAAQLLDIESLMTAQSGKFVNSSTHQVFKNREWLVIIEQISQEQHHYIINDLGEYEFNLGKLFFNILPENESMNIDANVAFLDKSKIQFPIILRKWEEGDYFYPLGLGKKKKIGRFCIDQKLSKSAKDKVWVLEMSQKIIWVIGLRIDDRFKLSPNTKNILSIEFKSC